MKKWSRHVCVTWIVAGWLLPLASHAQIYAPLPTTGYDSDVIAETTDILNSTDAVLDGSGYVLYTKSVGSSKGSSGGLPDDGVINSGSSASYMLQNANGKNALLITPGQTKSLTLTTPAPLQAISLLGFSTEGTIAVNISAHFVDNSKKDFPAQTMQDWFYGSGAVLSGFNRVGRVSGLLEANTTNPRMYALNNVLDCSLQNKLIDRIDVTTAVVNSLTSKLAVFGISAAPPDSILTPITGANSLIVGEQAQLASTPSGGTWSSDNNGVASIDARGGLLTGVAAGNATITYAVTQACSTDQVTMAVNVARAPTTTTISAPASLTVGEQASVGISVSANAPSSAIPTGDVQVSLGAQNCVATLNTGVGSCQIVPAVAGSATLNASFGQGTNFLASDNSQSVNVAKATTLTTLTLPTSLTVGNAVSLTVTVSPSSANVFSPTGTVTVSGAGGNCSAQLSNGLASCTITPSLNGAGAVFTASFTGDANFSASTDSKTGNVDLAGTSIALSATPNPSMPGEIVTFSVTVNPSINKSAHSLTTKAGAAPSGTITLTDGPVTLGTATLDGSGIATMSVKTLTSLGVHSIVASYSGDANFAAIQSAAFTQVVSAAPAAMPVPLFGELWEKLLLSLMVVGVSALLLRMRRAA